MYPELMELVGTAASVPPTYGGGFQRQVSLGEAISRGFKNYATFTGRASRSEFWWWMLFYNIIYAGVYMLTASMMGDQLQAFMLHPEDLSLFPVELYVPTGLLGLALFLPNLSVTVRRLHDTGRSGWWYLLNLLCCIGPIILLVWYCQPSQEFENEYGPEPNVE